MLRGRGCPTGERGPIGQAGDDPGYVPEAIAAHFEDASKTPIMRDEDGNTWCPADYWMLRQGAEILRQTADEARQNKDILELYDAVGDLYRALADMYKALGDYLDVKG